MIDRDLEQDESDFYPDWADGLTQEEYEEALEDLEDRRHEEKWEREQDGN